MSRVGKHSIVLPQGVTVTVNGEQVTVKGKLGELTTQVSDKVTVTVDNNEIVVKPVAQTK